MLQRNAMNHADTFRWISIAVSIVLGLGVARLLTAFVAQFHARRHRRADWVPLVWAGAIFFQQLGFWWSLDELAAIVPRWTLGSFLFLIGLALGLFLAAALILPHTDGARADSLRAFFEEDGRWALPVLAGFNLLALAANSVFWGETLTSVPNSVNLAMAALPLVAFRANRPIQALATAAYAVITVLAVVDLSPAAY